MVKGYFKVNNSLVIQPEYQDKMRNAIKETVDINKNANPDTLWEIIKGGIRNETIKYASFKKKEQNKKEIQLNEEINKIKNNLMKGNDNEEDDLKRLKEKDQELQNLYELEIKGYIIRSKADYIEGGEKNTKYFADLEKKRSDGKTLHKLVKNDKEFTKQKDILEEVKSFYENIYTEKNVDIEKMETMSKNIKVKLNEEEKK